MSAKVFVLVSILAQALPSGSTLSCHPSTFLLLSHFGTIYLKKQRKKLLFENTEGKDKLTTIKPPVLPEIRITDVDFEFCQKTTKVSSCGTIITSVPC